MSANATQVVVKPEVQSPKPDAQSAAVRSESEQHSTAPSNTGSSPVNNIVVGVEPELEEILSSFVKPHSIRSNGSDGGVYPSGRIRRIPYDSTIKELFIKIYGKEPRPSSQLKTRLADVTGLTTTKVGQWFNNKRSQMRVSNTQLSFSPQPSVPSSEEPENAQDGGVSSGNLDSAAQNTGPASSISQAVSSSYAPPTWAPPAGYLSSHGAHFNHFGVQGNRQQQHPSFPGFTPPLYQVPTAPFPGFAGNFPGRHFNNPAPLHFPTNFSSHDAPLPLNMSSSFYFFPGGPSVPLKLRQQYLPNLHAALPNLAPAPTNLLSPTLSSVGQPNVIEENSSTINSSDQVAQTTHAPQNGSKRRLKVKKEIKSDIQVIDLSDDDDDEGENEDNDEDSEEWAAAREELKNEPNRDVCLPKNGSLRFETWKQGEVAEIAEKLKLGPGVVKRMKNRLKIEQHAENLKNESQALYRELNLKKNFQIGNVISINDFLAFCQNFKKVVELGKNCNF
ncbi:hypothetical protein CRE_23656 [Caenorhabditis remanei]|uniref:Homeobox domain-containing protein n=1 Tax=Caenorhabditis remanei TaxID=31234 RepID=E3N4B8_CAERE|nr:hypothetical protein CRE_23656 [Caenorhabditis remanei]